MTPGRDRVSAITVGARHVKFCMDVYYKQRINLKSAVFWVITRRRVVTVYRRFGTTYRSHLHGSRVRVPKRR
jgi:hypothetical protein